MALIRAAPDLGVGRISLNFATGQHYIKLPGQPARRGRFEDFFTFTRNNSATFRAQSGLLVYANENIAVDEL